MKSQIAGRKALVKRGGRLKEQLTKMENEHNYLSICFPTPRFVPYEQWLSIG